VPEHVHVHAPHELSEPAAEREPVSPRERTLEIVAALVMSLATLGIAWSGYQAARWSGLQSQRYAQANTARALANRNGNLATQQRIQDLLNFNRWLEASTEGNSQLADLYARRFRDEFRPAFEAWLAQDPLHNVNATASPLNMPQYRPADLEKSNALEKVADERFTQGKDATEHADDYVFITVFFAAVLFFAGMSLRFAWARMRILVLAFGVVLLAYGGTRLLALPTH
jgi:hypothetical protein